jgi:hypothetical protein
MRQPLAFSSWLGQCVQYSSITRNFSWTPWTKLSIALTIISAGFSTIESLEKNKHAYYKRNKKMHASLPKTNKEFQIGT